MMKEIIFYIRVAVFIVISLVMMLALFVGFSEMMGQSMRLGLACMMIVALSYQFVFWNVGGKNDD